jgi:hypothetical protein
MTIDSKADSRATDDAAMRLHEYLFFGSIIQKYENRKTYLRYCITKPNLRLSSMSFWS